MALLVIFDVPAVKPRRNLQRALSRLGFRQVFPNTFERQESVPGPAAVEREAARILAGQVYHFRVYSIVGRSTVRVRWGK